MSLNFSSKHLTLQEITKITNALGNLAKSTLHEHSLALIIGKTGEATFTRCGWKILSESGCSSPVSKIIIIAAKNYTTSCGEDCKFLLFILNEMMCVVTNEIGKDEAFMRTKLIHDICSMKQILPCIFNSIRNSSEVRVTSLDSFLNDLHSIVHTFMLSRFSTTVSEHLSSLICDFIHAINCKTSPLRVILRHVISNFSDFCSKVLSSVSESQILKGFVFSKRHATTNLELENGKFIIIWNLSMKTVNDVSLKICNETFIEDFNYNQFHHKIFTYFKKEGIKLLLTPSVGNKDIKLLCVENDIILLDRLDSAEIEHILSCTIISPLENLNEAPESKHIGQLKHLKLLYFNNSCFLNLDCLNTETLLNAHHIILSAPIEALWKEYYAECLNCFKMVLQWLCPNSNVCSYKSNSIFDGRVDTLPQSSTCRNIEYPACSQLEVNVDNSLKNDKTTISKIVKSGQNIQSDSIVKDTVLILSHQPIKSIICVCSQLDLSFNKCLKTSNAPISDVLKLNQDIQSDSSMEESVNRHTKQPACEITNFNDCLHLDLKFDNSLKISKALIPGVADSDRDIGISLLPVKWEFLFLTSLEKVSGNLSLPCRNISLKLHFAVTKMICAKMGVSVCSVKNLKNACTEFFEKPTKDNKIILEPAACKESLIYTILDLMLQLLKIDGIITSK